MRINRVFFKNYRAIGNSGLSLEFSSGTTVLVGENNVGKTSIFKGIRKALTKNATWASEDWYAGNRANPIHLEISFHVDEALNKTLSGLLGLSAFPHPVIKKGFGDELKLVVTNTNNRYRAVVKYGELSIVTGGNGALGWLGEIKQDGGYRPGFRWEDCISGANPLLPDNLMPIIRNKWKVACQGDNNSARIEFSSDIFSILLDQMAKAVVVIDEFRELPVSATTNSQTSESGRELASMLFNLKNGRPPLRKQFEEILSTFRQIYPNLELNIVRDPEKSEIYIHTLKKDASVESTTAYLGAGVIQSLLLISHLVAHGDNVLLIDHPEIHLHPHAQRIISDLISKAKSQTVLITHVPYFVSLKKGATVMRLFQQNGQVASAVPSSGAFTEKELLKHEQLLNTDAREIFFSRKVVLVEGETEVGALPEFGSRLGYSFNGNNTSVIATYGKNNIPTYVKVCMEYKIPCLVLADNDAGGVIGELRRNYPSLKAVVLDGDFEAMLPIELKEEAKKEVGNSKPRIGRYVAAKMGDVPPHIKELFKEIRYSGDGLVI